MKTKKKFVLGGFVLVAIASVILFMSFGFIGKERTQKRRTPVVQANFIAAVDQLVNSANQVSVSATWIYVDWYNPLAICIKKGLDNAGIETIGIVLIPDLLNPNGIHSYYNTGNIVREDILPTELRYNSRGEAVDYRSDHTIGKRLGDSSEVIGYSWQIVRDRGKTIACGEEEGINCSLDTETIREIVCSCLSKHKLITGENGRVVIFTEDGWVAINTSCEVVACRDWVSEPDYTITTTTSRPEEQIYYYKDIGSK